VASESGQANEEFVAFEAGAFLVRAMVITPMPLQMAGKIPLPTFRASRFGLLLAVVVSVGLHHRLVGWVDRSNSFVCLPECERGGGGACGVAYCS